MIVAAPTAVAPPGGEAVCWEGAALLNPCAGRVNPGRKRPSQALAAGSYPPGGSGDMARQASDDGEDELWNDGMNKIIDA